MIRGKYSEHYIIVTIICIVSSNVSIEVFHLWERFVLAASKATPASSFFPSLLAAVSSGVVQSLFTRLIVSLNSIQINNE